MATQEAAGDVTVCRECGKPIEADARFCRFCSKPQPGRTVTAASAGAGPAASPSPPTSTANRPSTPARSGAAGGGLEPRLRQLFPRHHLQDDFMHIGSIAAFFMAAIGFVLGFFPAYSWLAGNFLFGSIALLLFLILRESTLSHIRVQGGRDAGSTPAGGRTHAARPTPPPAELPADAATTQSSPPGAGASGPGTRPPVSKT